MSIANDRLLGLCQCQAPVGGQSLRLRRVDSLIHQRLACQQGLLCTVQWLFPGGFYGITETGSPLYFYGGDLLAVPFGLIVGPDLSDWLDRFALEPGDCLFKRGDWVWLQDFGPMFPYAPESVIDLAQKIVDHPPDLWRLERWIQHVVHAIYAANSGKGLTGLLNRLPSHLLCGTFPETAETRLAGLKIDRALASALRKDPYGIIEALDGIIGLGSGLTPAADDVIVGFLSALALLRAPLWNGLRQAARRLRLSDTLPKRTTAVSAELLRFALLGRFSELIRNGLTALSKSGAAGSEALADFFRWGHSSGIDTLVGLALGLAAVRASAL